MDKNQATTHVANSFLNLWGGLSDFSSWITIIGFLLTIYLLITTSGIKDKVNRSFKLKYFKLDKGALKNELESARNLIIKEPENKNNLYELTQPLRRLKEYKIYMDMEDKAAYREALSFVKRGSIKGNEDKMIHDLGVLIGFLSKRIEIDTKNF